MRLVHRTTKVTRFVRFITLTMMVFNDRQHCCFSESMRQARRRSTREIGREVQYDTTVTVSGVVVVSMQAEQGPTTSRCDCGSSVLVICDVDTLFYQKQTSFQDKKVPRPKMASPTLYTPPLIDHLGFAYVGSFRTVCKGINRADDVKLTEKSALFLKPQPDNKFDPNAIRVVTRTSSTGSGSGSVPAEKEFATGYLPKKLAAEIVQSLNDTTNVVVDCVMVGQGQGTRLMSKRIDTWYEIQLDWFVSKAAAPEFNAKLKSQVETWAQHETSYLE